MNMSNRNLFFALIFSSLLGGTVAVGGYTLFVEAPQSQQVVPAANSNDVSFTNYVLDTTNFVVPEGLNFVYAAKSATPAVVHIRTSYSSEQSSASRNPLEEFFNVPPRGQRERRRGGAGSGVIVTSDGYIATNNHVVEGASEIEVILNDNRSYRGEVIGADPDTDIALVKIEGENFPTVNFGDSENIQIGEWVLAIGNPFDFRSTVTAGIVSATARNINILSRGRNGGSNTQIEAFIQTDAAVNPGNSGGALINLKGELVGINTAIASPTGAFAGYSFAVPTTLVKKVVNDLKEFGAVQRPLLGIEITDVNAAIADAENLDVLKGVFVSNVNAGTAAAEAGLQGNDVIIAIDGKKVSNVAQLQEQVALNSPGDKIEVTFIREGKTKTVSATLKNQAQTMEIVRANRSFEIEGARLQPISEEIKREIGLEYGLQIREIERGKWNEAGIEEGFIITRIDKRPIGTIDDLTSALENARGEGILIEGIYPSGEKAYYGIGW